MPAGSTWAQANAIRRHVGAIVEGNTADAKELRESVEGKARQRVEVTGAEGTPLIPGSMESLSDDELEERWKKMEAVVRASRAKDWNE